MEYQSRSYAPPPAAAGGPAVTFTKGVENLGNHPRPGQPALADSTPFTGGPAVWIPGTPTGVVTPETAPTVQKDPLQNLPHPRIVYVPGSVNDPPDFSVIDLHDPRTSPAMNISPPSTEDIGDLGRAHAPLGSDFPTIDQGIEQIGNIGEGSSGIRPMLAPYHDDIPGTEPPATIGLHPQPDGSVPWQADEPGDIPPKFTVSTNQVWGDD